MLQTLHHLKQPDHCQTDTDQRRGHAEDVDRQLDFPVEGVGARSASAVRRTVALHE